MRIGRYDVQTIETGRFALDGGAMFGVVPFVFWSRTNPPDDRMRIELASRSLLVRGDGRTILVDNGNGNKFSEKLKDIYRLDVSESDLLTSLARHGVKPEDVTDVILTHLHFDHAGGSTIRQDGTLIPAFPKARYYVQRKQWEQSQTPTEKDRASFMPDDFLPLKNHGVLEFLDGGGELFPGIDLLVCDGHTTAQQLPRLSDGETTLLFCCDLVPTASHVPLPYVMAYDLRPLVTIDEKKLLLGRAAEEEWLLFLQHDPATEVITVKKTEKGFAVSGRRPLG